MRKTPLTVTCTVTGAVAALCASVSLSPAMAVAAPAGGVVTVFAQSAPYTMDPTNIYEVDATEIGRLLFRTPTAFVDVNGAPTLVSDLTDLGSVSADGLTWTFTLKPGAKYEDGSDVVAEDLAYAVKRSFARDVHPDGPTYLMTYLKGGDTYKGPYTGGDSFEGVSVSGNKLILNLRTPFADLPNLMTFPMFTPIPKAKDTKQDYGKHPLATGPFKFESFDGKTSLKLVRNTHWSAAADTARQPKADGFVFSYGDDAKKSQASILDGSAASAVSFNNVDKTLLQQASATASQLVLGDTPCTSATQMDSRKIPLEVRKAIAKAFPYDGLNALRGASPLTMTPASTILPPSVPGYTKYAPVEDLSGVGAGNPVAAKAMLEKAGKLGFELSWYYNKDRAELSQVSQLQADALTAAGFTVKPVGVAQTELGAKVRDYNAPVNMGQAPGGWCSDWPSGASWFPVLFRSVGVAQGLSWGMLQDPELDAKINAVSSLPAAQAVAKWGELDREIMSRYVVLPQTHNKMACVVGKNIAGAKGDPAQGVLSLIDLYVK